MSQEQKFNYHALYTTAENADKIKDMMLSIGQNAVEYLEAMTGSLLSFGKETGISGKLILEIDMKPVAAEISGEPDCMKLMLFRLPEGSEISVTTIEPDANGNVMFFNQKILMIIIKFVNKKGVVTDAQ